MGKSTLTTLVSNNFSGYNSIRYRGYYYDEDTGLYYLNARYYNPQWRRFISPANASSLNPDSVNGLHSYCYAGNNPVVVAYGGFNSGSAGAMVGGSVSSIGTGVESINSGYQGIISNSSNILSALGALSSAFGFFDQWSGYLSGGLEAGLSYWGPKGVGFQFLGQYSNALSKFGKGMAVAGAVLSWGSSVYNNFTNPNYTIGEAYVASALDAAYYGITGALKYKVGVAVGGWAINAGMAVGMAAVGLAGAIGLCCTGAVFVGICVGAIFAIGIGVAGSYAIYRIGGLVDDGWEWLKKQIFE